MPAATSTAPVAVVGRRYAISEGGMELGETERRFVEKGAEKSD